MKKTILVIFGVLIMLSCIHTNKSKTSIQTIRMTPIVFHIDTATRTIDSIYFGSN